MERLNGELSDSKGNILSPLPNPSKIANNCTTTVDGFVLDARQGKTLMDKVDRTNSDLAANLNGVKIIPEGSGTAIKYYAQLGADAASKKLLGSAEHYKTVPLLLIALGGFSAVFETKRISQITIVNVETMVVFGGATVDGEWTNLGANVNGTKTYDVSKYAYVRVADTVGSGYRYCYVDGPTDFIRLAGYDPTVFNYLRQPDVSSMSVNYTDSLRVQKLMTWGIEPATVFSYLSGQTFYKIEDYSMLKIQGNNSKVWDLSLS